MIVPAITQEMPPRPFASWIWGERRKSADTGADRLTTNFRGVVISATNEDLITCEHTTRRISRQRVRETRCQNKDRANDTIERLNVNQLSGNLIRVEDTGDIHDTRS